MKKLTSALAVALVAGTTSIATVQDAEAWWGGGGPWGGGPWWGGPWGGGPWGGYPGYGWGGYPGYGWGGPAWGGVPYSGGYPTVTAPATQSAPAETESK